MVLRHEWDTKLNIVRDFLIEFGCCWTSVYIYLLFAGTGEVMLKVWVKQISWTLMLTMIPISSKILEKKLLVDGMTREYQEVSKHKAVKIGSFSPKKSCWKLYLCSCWRLCKSWSSWGWKSPVKTKTRRTQKFPTWSSWETKRAICVRSCFSAFCVWTTEQSTETNKSCWWCSFVQVRLGGRNKINFKEIYHIWNIK